MLPQVHGDPGRDGGQRRQVVHHVQPDPHQSLRHPPATDQQRVEIVVRAQQHQECGQRGEWPPGFPDERRTEYDLGEIRRWLEVFVKRFFGFAQFKRSALPNGPKVSAGGSLSPRGDWRAPSDGNARAWLADLERVPRGD